MTISRSILLLFVLIFLAVFLHLFGLFSSGYLAFSIIFIFSLVGWGFVSFRFPRPILVTEDRVIKPRGRLSLVTFYEDIQSYTVSRITFRGKTFKVIRFEVTPRFRINSPAKEIAIPDDVDCSVLLEKLAHAKSN
jgi:hypothetical protein